MDVTAATDAAAAAAAGADRSTVTRAERRRRLEAKAGEQRDDTQRERMEGQGRDGLGMVDEAQADGPMHSSSIVSRIDSVCISLLYFLVFPCAQTVLSGGMHGG